MTDRLTGIHALITGAASGIGAACARRMAGDGAQLLLADVNGDGAKALADELGQAFIQADVTRAADIKRMLDAAYQRWGRLDVLFNNAGIAEIRPLLELTEDEWDRMLAVNLRAVFFLLQAAAKRMRQQAPIAGSELRGKLIQTASIAAYRGGLSLMAHYAASKAGVVSITRTAAQVLAPDRITSNCICPGAVETPMWKKIDAEWTKLEGLRVGEAWKRRTSVVPLGRPETAEDVAGVISFLASRDSDYMPGHAGADHERHLPLVETDRGYGIQPHEGSWPTSVAVIVTTFPRTVRVIEHTLIPLKDGTKLAARIWLPDDAEQNPVPAILEYLPYRKRDGTYERDALTHPYLAGHGYAGVRVDLRGSGESEGLLFDEYTKQEHDDGLEVIAWLAAQRWCSGVVGVMGISWGGVNGV